MNVIHATYRASVRRLLFLELSYIYSKLAPYLMTEECPMESKLESTNRPDALNKIAGLEIC